VSMVQLPGVNTTQFKLTRNKMPNKPRPMGAIYEPEVAARGILYAADNDEREVFVGAPAFQTIWGNKLFPGLADQALGRTGVTGQLTDEPADPAARDYLFEHVPGDHGYKGGFAAKARDVSPVLWLTMNKWFGAALVGGLAAAGAALLLRSDNSSEEDDDDYEYQGSAYRSSQPRYVKRTVYPNYPARYPSRNLSGIHGGAPDEQSFNRSEQGYAGTDPGEVSLNQARRRDEPVVLDGID